MNIQSLNDRGDEAAELLALMANPQRLRILCVLLEGERYVGELAELVGLSQSAISQHLARLREGGIVSARRQAQTNYYSITENRAARILELLEELFCAPEVGESGAKSA